MFRAVGTEREAVLRVEMPPKAQMLLFNFCILLELLRKKNAAFQNPALPFLHIKKKEARKVHLAQAAAMPLAQLPQHRG